MILYGGSKYHIFTSMNLLEWKDEYHPGIKRSRWSHRDSYFTYGPRWIFLKERD